MDFVNDDGENVCPLCMEEMDLTDRQLKPCKCGYEICVWCWHQVMEVAEKDNTEGRCPACRTPYDKEKIVGMTFNCERLMDASSEKRQKSQKSKAKASEMRKHLSNVRVIQRNLVYIIGIPSNLADEETLERREFFGQYGKVLKVSISKPSASNQHSSSNPTSNVYITYTKEEEAIRCIQVVNGYVLDGRPLKACFGTTKYCHAWLKNMPCNNPDCLYLHDIGTQEDSFTKEEMVSTCASKIPQFHGPTNPLQRRGGSCLPPPELEVCSTNLASSSKPSVKAAVSNVGGQAKTTVANGSTGKATPLPAAASWGLRVTQGKTLPTKAPIIPVSTKLKSSSSHTLSVSPPSNPPTSAAVVAAAAAATSLLHSDHIQPSLVVVSGNGSQTTQTSPCSVISKQNIKNQQTRTNLTNGVAADSSAGTPTTEKYIREDSPERRTRESRLQQNRGFHEVIGRASDISLQSSAPTASLNIQNVSTEKSGYASVSSNLMTRSLCQEASVNFNHNFDDISTSALNESSRAFHSSFNARKLPLDALTVSANLLRSDCNKPDEKSMAQSINEVCVSEIEDQCTSTEAEEQSPGSVTKMLSETAGKLKHGFPLDANRRSFHSWKSTATSEAYADTAISKTDPSAVLPLETLNLDILNNNFFKTDKVDRKSDFSRVRSEGSILTPFQDSSIAEDRTIKVSAPAGEQISEGFSISEKSQRLERHDSDKTHIRHHSGIDSGEDKIISNILSLNIDIWEDDSITSPHDVVTKALLGEKDKVSGFPKDISSSRKLQNNGQSRFSFARHDGSSVESSHSSSKSPISSGQLQETWSKGKDSLDDRAGSEQVNRPLNDRAAFDHEEYQILSNRSAPPPLSGSAVAPPSVSRSQFSAPPGFSVPTRGPQVPPPGFLPQPRVERTYEPPTTVFSNGTKDQNEPILSQNAFPSLYSSANQTLGGNSSNDVEFIDPAIMAVGKGKFPIGQIQRGSAGPDSVFSGPRQDLSDSSFGQSYLGLRSPFLQQVSSTDYDARLQMLKQKPFYSNSSLTSPRQQFTFQDQIGDITSYLSRQNDTMIPSMMREQSQVSLDSVFSQQSFQQPMNLSYRSSSVGANGWGDSWNRMSSAIESGLGERNFLEMGNKERMGAWDPKSGLNKSFPTYGESMYHMPCSENYYSRPFEM